MPESSTLPHGVGRPRFLSESSLPSIRGALDGAERASAADASRVLAAPGVDLAAAAILLRAGRRLPLGDITAAAREATDRSFGRSILLYAPCYLSSFCVNHCRYCGFNYTMEIPRRQLRIEEALEEVDLLERQGMRRILLVAGEYPSMVTPDYIQGMVEAAARRVPEVDLEVGPVTTGVYRQWRDAGAGGVTCYQETYDPVLYRELHPRGPKRHFEFRAGTPERAGRAGMARLGIGALLGLSDPDAEILSLIAHSRFLMKTFPGARVTVSLPRLRPAGNEFRARWVVDDDALVRYYAVLRLALPEAGLIVSTREPAAVRRRLPEAGITQMSAGSVTSPGGYASHREDGGQFDVADHRSIAEVVDDIGRQGYEVRWTSHIRAAC